MSLLRSASKNTARQRCLFSISPTFIMFIYISLFILYYIYICVFFCPIRPHKPDKRGTMENPKRTNDQNTLNTPNTSKHDAPKPRWNHPTGSESRLPSTVNFSGCEGAGDCWCMWCAILLFHVNSTIVPNQNILYIYAIIALKVKLYHNGFLYIYIYIFSPSLSI